MITIILCDQINVNVNICFEYVKSNAVQWLNFAVDFSMPLLSTFLIFSLFDRLESFLSYSGLCSLCQKRRIYCSVGSFTLSVVSRLPKVVLHRVRSSASSFNVQSPIYSLRSSSSCLVIFPRLPVTYIISFIFPSITCFRRQFLRKT